MERTAEISAAEPTAEPAKKQTKKPESKKRSLWARFTKPAPGSEQGVGMFYSIRFIILLVLILLVEIIIVGILQSGSGPSISIGG